ncbi:Transcription factor GTE1 [Morella rubra]|uniref:Transcription factor GTE1 n=1 Tax=Morella rubra TaxID=262757 RepID=A0A6A1VZR3_9ROSI|nr:Transcription factor GTE1 [Morella rubra]
MGLWRDIKAEDLICVGEGPFFDLGCLASRGSSTTVIWGVPAHHEGNISTINRSDVHVMAKTLLEKFKEKWLQLLPKVTEEEKRREDEEGGAQLEMQLAQAAAHATCQEI